MKLDKKPLDPVAKLGIGVLCGSFALIGIGMFLSRPDRSIPPYSIGSQEGTVVAIHLPSWTSDTEIKAFIHRIKKVGKETRDFGHLKIRPTTPDHPSSRYQHVTIYIFSDHRWTTPEVLHQYLKTLDGNTGNDTFKKQFESSVRGGYHIDAAEEKGWIGPIVPEGKETPTSRVQWLFKEVLHTEPR